jgi:hypothetical protein
LTHRAFAAFLAGRFHLFVFSPFRHFPYAKAAETTGSKSKNYANDQVNFFCFLPSEKEPTKGKKNQQDDGNSHD